MSEPEPLFGLGDQKTSRGPTARELIATLVVPILTLIAYIAVRPRQSLATYGLLAIAILSLLAGLYSPAAAWLRAKSLNRSDRRAAKRALPEFRRLITSFQGFVGHGRCTLHSILASEVCGNNPSLLNRFGLPDANVFSGFYQVLANGSGREQFNFALFKNTISAFGWLVGAYNNYCVRVVFEDLPRELSQNSELAKNLKDQVDWERAGVRSPSELAESTRRQLNLRREEFYLFVSDYERLINNLGEGFNSRQFGWNTAITHFPRSSAL
ncbi:MAG: hypothetical protein ACRD2H_13115 [Terriglobales bacterium]